MKPIIFNTEMVRAILDGRKTMTTRPISPQPKIRNRGLFIILWNDLEIIELNEGRALKRLSQHSPYQVGDVLYVRETWADVHTINEIDCLPIYRADSIDGEGVKWRPSIYMPKEYARLFLKITDIKARRLRDITESEAQREGWDLSDTSGYETYDPVYMTKAIGWFRGVWESTYSKKGLRWIDDPWVWTYAFKVVSNPEGPQND